MCAPSGRLRCRAAWRLGLFGADAGDEERELADLSRRALTLGLVGADAGRKAMLRWESRL